MGCEELLNLSVSDIINGDFKLMETTALLFSWIVGTSSRGSGEGAEGGNPVSVYFNVSKVSNDFSRVGERISA